MGSEVAHYAALVVAENPVELHKDYMEQLEEEENEEDDLEALETGRLQSNAVTSDIEGELAEEAAVVEAELRQINISRHGGIPVIRY